MSIEEESEAFYRRLQAMRASEDRHERTVAMLWDDVTDRRGWRQEADHFDYATKNEILDRWLEIVRR